MIVVDLDLDFDLLWKGLTQGQNWLLAVLVLVLTWLGGRFQAVAGRRAEGFIERRWDLAISATRKRRSARQYRKEREAAAEKVERIREERVGRKFLRKISPEDVGMTGEVVDLSPERPDDVVVTVWNSPANRDSHPSDYSNGERQRIAWRHLVASPAEQRAYTARHYAEPSDDVEGWVEFEEIIT